MIRGRAIIGTSFAVGSAVCSFYCKSISLSTFADGKEDESWAKKILGKFAPDLPSIDLQKLDAKRVFAEASKSTHSIVEHEAFGKVSYGFIMGYASGFCVKKVSYSIIIILFYTIFAQVSRMIAFTVGGIFIIVQVLAYNGYVSVNLDKFQSDIEVSNY